MNIFNIWIGTGNIQTNGSHLNTAYDGYDQDFPFVPIEFTVPAAGSAAAQYRSTMQSLENGFIGLKFNCFQPTKDGAIS